MFIYSILLANFFFMCFTLRFKEAIISAIVGIYLTKIIYPVKSSVSLDIQIPNSDAIAIITGSTSG